MIQKRFFYVFLCWISLSSIYINAQEQPDLFKNADQQLMSNWVDSIFDSMSLDERIGQLFMIVVDPTTNSKNTQRIINQIKEIHVGGILFSKGNLHEQATSTNLYQKSSRIPLFISLDGEWGLSMRLQDTPKYPRNMVLGAITNNDMLYYYGEEVGHECKKMGIHINFAPVLDVNSNPKNPVIGTRSFGENPISVASKGIAYAKGLESTGIIAVAKHFPGHGDTAEDSHETTPSVNHEISRLEKIELYPFTRYINAGLSGVMTGHLNVHALDSTSGKPTSLSPVIVKELLQEKLKFSGLTFTDALVMKGASDQNQSVCVQALLAGNDILLSPENPVREFKAVKKAIEDGTLDMEDIEAKCLKILSYKYIAGLNNYKPINLNNLKSRLNSLYSEWLIRKLNAESITLLKNEKENVPVKGLENKKIAILSLGSAGVTEFQKIFNYYTDVKHFNIPLNANEKTIASVFKKLNDFDLIICGFHSPKVSNYSHLRQLSIKKEIICCYFLSPYVLNNYKESIEWSDATLLAYENTDFAQQAAAQVIMGGLAANGKLPVRVSGIFRVGTGIQTNKTRLAYQLPEEVNISSVKLKQIDSIVKNALDKKAFPGCQVLVAKDGVVIYNKAFGNFDYAGTHPVKTSDVYDLASVTKAAATVPALMKLYDENKINLDDHLSKYISKLKNTDKEEISIKNALLHESGLTSFIPFYQEAIDKKSYEGPLFSAKRDLVHRTEYENKVYARTDFKFKKELVSPVPKKDFDLQVAKHFYLNNNFRNIIMEQIIKSKLKEKNKYLYSDLNFILLMEMVENVSKMKFNNYLDKNFYSKLGAFTTTFNPLERIDTANIAPTENDQFLRNQILIGFTHDEAAAFMGGVSGNAGLFSNANDLAKLFQMLLNNGSYGGEQFLSEATVELFTKTKSSNSRRGLGFDKPDTETIEKSPCGKLAPDCVYGHTGFTGTSFWVDPENQLIFIFLSNRVYPSRTNKELSKLGVRSRIQDTIYEAFK